MIIHDDLKVMSAAIRVLAADSIQNANSGHPGMPLGMADVMTILYKYFIKFNPEDPTWINRDRLILSAGHGSMLLYSILFLTGYKKFSLEVLKNFRQIHSLAAGHPEICHNAGIEVTTGPLGHGVAMAVGKAIASKKLSALYPEIINNKIYAVVGDGCLMEGISYEALALAGTLNLNNLILIWDNNNITIDGNVSISSIENQKMRFKAIGFLVLEVDGHSYEEVYKALSAAHISNLPVLISAKTKIAWGAPTKEGKSLSHGSPLGENEIQGLRNKLQWNHPPFFIPENVKNLWLNTAYRAKKLYNKWIYDYNNFPKKSELEQFFIKNEFLNNLPEAINNLANDILKEKPNKATRLSSLDVLNEIAPVLPGLIGGSADLSNSVMTKHSSSVILNKSNYTGNYIYYGIREHAMGAIINGLAAYGGFIPYGGTFLVFSDFLRPAIRLAALQKLQSIFVLTHDSIGVGEDGPTHQPVEHLASLRLIPDIDIIRPCDGIEALEAWLIALHNLNKPTCLIFSRQNLPTLRTTFNYNNNLTSKGGYILYINNNDSLLCYSDDKCKNINIDSLDINLIASGSEVSLAKEVSLVLSKKGISSKVISMPSLNLFKKNSKNYIKSVIGSSILNVVIEAATICGYSSFLDPTKVLNFGINEFGKSGKGSDLYKYFGLTTENIVNKILLRLQNNG